MCPFQDPETSYCVKRCFFRTPSYSQVFQGCPMSVSLLRAVNIHNSRLYLRSTPPPSNSQDSLLKMEESWWSLLLVAGVVPNYALLSGTRNPQFPFDPFGFDHRIPGHSSGSVLHQNGEQAHLEHQRLCWSRFKTSEPYSTVPTGSHLPPHLQGLMNSTKLLESILQ